MKSIFQQLFPKKSEKEEPGTATPLPITAFPESLYEHQKQSLAEWLADRMCRRYNAGSAVTEGTLSRFLEIAIAWIECEERKADVRLTMMGFNLSEREHRCFLETYEEHKGAGERYLVDGGSGRRDYSADDEVWEVYRDVIAAATQHKFLLIRMDEADAYRQGRTCCTAVIAERSDIPKARDSAKQCFTEIGTPAADMMSRLLVVSEAITNILKHARSGTMTIMERATAIHVIVEDEGPGFPLKQLPNMTLTAGYSTKKSLGQGFTLMMKMADRILLSTVAGVGSTLILVFNRKETEPRHESSLL